jgi:hypothetical protein
MIVHVTDHYARAYARLMEALKGKPKFAGLLAVVSAEIQVLEDALWDLYTKRLLLATDAQLDNVGNIVGESRDGDLDADYLLRIQARIKVNKSSGTPEDLYAVLRSLIPGGKQQLINWGNATLTIIVSNFNVSDAMALKLLSFLVKARVGGVRVNLEYLSLDTDEYAFMTPLASFATAPITGGVDNEVFVDSTDGFPDAGSLVADEAVSEDEGNYASKTPTSFRAVPGQPLFAASHVTGTCIRLAGDLGKGFAEHFTQVRTLVNVTDTHVDADDTTGFPASGSITIDAGLATEETVTYASKTGTAFNGTSAALQTHPVGAGITLASDDESGRLAAAIGE